MDEPVTEWVPGTPAPALAPFVDAYCGYRLTGFAPGIHRGVPSRHLTFIVGIDRPIDVVAQTDSAQRPERYGCVLSGLQASPALIEHDGEQEGVAIELSPLGVRALFGMPARELWNRSYELADVVGAPGRELWERLHETRDWTARFAVCDDVLTPLVRGELVVPELRQAWTDLVAAGGGLSVEELSARTGWSRQHLTRRFRDEFGLGPKVAARVIRFERARRMLLGTPSFVSIAQVAAVCGYYDQAHLDRDFAAFAGCTPSQMVREEVPHFQDEEPLERASSGA